MTNISRQTEFWLKSADEDFDAGRHLVEAAKYRHGLFFIHLALEKMLKAHFCKNNKALPPKIHNLSRLYEVAGLDENEEKQNILAALNRFCLEGRYPEDWPAMPDDKEAKRYLEMAQEAAKWLRQQL